MPAAAPRIDLDANATTPLLPEVLEAMLPWLRCGGNPSSAHQSGQRTRAAIERARVAVARLLSCAAKEIVFTSGGTESNNLALSGVLQPFLDRREPAHLITTSIEHHAVLFAAEALEARGVEVTYLPPDTTGRIAPEALAASLRPYTRLVSIMFANNETGVVQPIGKLARVAKNTNQAANSGLLFHTDAVQGAGKLPLDLGGELKNVDLLSLSGHKMYAPQGTGVLFVRAKTALTPLLYGGPQERQRRAGTENVAGIVALGCAAELAHDWLAAPTDAPYSPISLAALRDHFEQTLLAQVPGTCLNGTPTQRTPNTTNLRFEGVDAEALLIALDMQGVATSFGAACQSGATEPSHVLLAMGLSPGEARSSLRFSLSRLTLKDDIDRACAIVPAAIARLRSLSSPHLVKSHS